ncbi:glycosyltransferase family 4 protein [Photobacterium damselae]|uniref:glycosyltransferase family 4 protein n=1 Tax=Photobacterium damselae TaxID=38293 RepID=UPI003B677E47
MKISYVHDFRFYTNGTELYTAVGLPEKYFDRFFNAGVSIISIISRSSTKEESEIVSMGFEKILNENLSIGSSFGNYFGLFSPRNIVATYKEISSSKLIVINFPSITGMYIYGLNIFANKPYIVEVAAGSDQFLSKKGGGFVTYLIEKIFPKVVSKSNGAIYVSSHLSVKYPHNISVVASNVYISKTRKANRILEKEKNVEILFAGGVNRRKGIDTLLLSIQQLVEDGFSNIRLNIAGGHLDRDYQAMAEELGIKDFVIFHGLLERAFLNELYDKADIYVQPSLAEGIPRATIEAMSYGLPVVATKLPGFREILDEEFLVSIGDHRELTQKIKNLIQEEDLYRDVSARNLSRANDFLISTLDSKRNEFYEKVFKTL